MPVVRPPQDAPGSHPTLPNSFLGRAEPWDLCRAVSEELIVQAATRKAWNNAPELVPTGTQGRGGARGGRQKLERGVNQCRTPKPETIPLMPANDPSPPQVQRAVSARGTIWGSVLIRDWTAVTCSRDIWRSAATAVERRSPSADTDSTTDSEATAHQYFLPCGHQQPEISARVRLALKLFAAKAEISAMAR